MANGEEGMNEEQPQPPDPASKLQIDAYELLIATKFEWFYRKALLAIVVIALISGFAMAGFGYVLIERGRALTAVCENGNKRHDNTIKALFIGSDLDQQNAKTEAAKAEIRRRRDVTISLIDAIAPKLDCDNPDHPAVKTKLPK